MNFRSRISRQGLSTRRLSLDFAELRSVIETAVEAGMTCLEVAPGAAEMQELLGRNLAEMGLLDHFYLLTHAEPVPPGLPRAEWARHLRAGLEETRRRLHLSRLPLVFSAAASGEGALEVLVALREGWLLERCGVSLEGADYEPGWMGRPEVEALLLTTHESLPEAVENRLVFLRSDSSQPVENEADCALITPRTLAEFRAAVTPA